MKRFFGVLMMLVAVVVTGCKEGQDCPTTAGCPQGAQCRCDAQGRLLTETRDLNGDGKADELRYVRNAAGAVEQIRQDWNRDGSIERQETFLFDEQGNRVGKEGYQIKCTSAERFTWKCSHEPPCPPPFRDCSKCVNRDELAEFWKRHPPCAEKK